MKIVLNKNVKDINFYEVNEEGYPNFIDLKNISNSIPAVIDYNSYISNSILPLLSIYDTFPSSLHLIIACAR